jgi:hypothetical protein
MTIANDIIFLSLRNSGVNGVGQTPMADDVNDSFKILNAMINEWNLQRRVQVNRITLPTFPDLTTDVSFWSPYVHVLLTTMAVRLRQIYSLPPVQLDVQLAVSALQAFNAINLHQVAPIVVGVPNTVRQAIFLALRMAGRITDSQSVSETSSDMNDAQSLLVMMLGQWQRKRWLTWNEDEVSIISTGNQWYTIGPGQDFDTARPDKIHAAWCRLKPFGGPMPVDLPLTIIEAKEDWASIGIKDLKSLPTAVFYDSSYPVGRITFWPVPIAAQYEMHLVVKASLPVYVTLDDPLNVPPEYLDAIINNLAVRIALASPQSKDINPLLLAQARASLNTIRLANSQIQQLSVPAALVGRGGGDVSSWVGRGLNHAWTLGGGCVLG